MTQGLLPWHRSRGEADAGEVFLGSCSSLTSRAHCSPLLGGFLQQAVALLLHLSHLLIFSHCRHAALVFQLVATSPRFHQPTLQSRLGSHTVPRNVLLIKVRRTVVACNLTDRTNGRGENLTDQWEGRRWTTKTGGTQTRHSDHVWHLADPQLVLCCTDGHLQT